MNAEAKLPSLENELARLLLLFDKDNKEDIARQLVDKFGLTQTGFRYDIQIEHILGRELLENERFKIWVLAAIHNPQYGGGGHGEEEE